MVNRLRLRTLAIAGVTALAVPAASLMVTTSAQAADNDGHYQGKVIANSLAVRSLPTTYGRKMTPLAKGSFVEIRCKLNAVNVDGNRRWYMLGASS